MGALKGIFRGSHKYLGTKKYSLTNKTEEEIDRLFNTRIGQVIKELEEDLQDLS